MSLGRASPLLTTGGVVSGQRQRRFVGATRALGPGRSGPWTSLPCPLCLGPDPLRHLGREILPTFRRLVVIKDTRSNGSWRVVTRVSVVLFWVRGSIYTFRNTRLGPIGFGRRVGTVEVFDRPLFGSIRENGRTPADHYADVPVDVEGYGRCTLGRSGPVRSPVVGHRRRDRSRHRDPCPTGRPEGRRRVQSMSKTSKLEQETLN